MNNDPLKRKLEYATQEEILKILLNDIDFKFKKAIKLWSNNDSKGTVVVSKIIDCITELKLTLIIDNLDSETKKHLENIKTLYEYIIDQLIFASLKKDVVKLQDIHTIFLTIKEMFISDMKNT